MQKFQVERALDVEKRCWYLIVENGMPMASINDMLMVQQSGQSRPDSSPAYMIVNFLNYLDGKNKTYLDATLGDIQAFLDQSRLDQGKSFVTIQRYINILDRLYSNVIRQGLETDKSIFMKTTEGVCRKKSTSLTRIKGLKARYAPKISEGDISTNKYWLTATQAQTLAQELPSVYRCIFLCGIQLGYRIDSILSLDLESIDMRKKEITPRRTKTGQSHISHLPDAFEQSLICYLVEREAIVRKTGSLEKALFLNRYGRRVTYHAVLKAFKAACSRLGQKRPELGVPLNIKTHDCRRSFCAMLRNEQLEAQRQGRETITDAELAYIMDWRSVQMLSVYDKQTRAVELSGFMHDFYKTMY